MTTSKNKLSPEELARHAAELEARVEALRVEAEGRGQVEEELRRRTHDLGERVKELNCLYAIYNLSEQRHISVDEILGGTTRLIPPAWHYPEITSARITFRDRVFTTETFRETQWRQACDIFVQDERTGCVEVFYLNEMPELDEGPFLKEERNLINAIADQLGLLIERAQTESALRDSERKLHALSQKVLTTQEAERARLSRELHDELGHLLATARLEIDWVRKRGRDTEFAGNLEQALQLVQNATGALRRICKGLRPMIPDYVGLGLAIEALIDDFRAHSGLEIDATLLPVEGCAFDPDIAINIYRVLQEMLTNIARHANARRVRVRFELREGSLALEVEDDGLGMPDAAHAESDGVGIVGMRERAALFGGALFIESEPGSGARVQLRIPAHFSDREISS